MLGLSNEIFNALSRYLSADWSIDTFRDYVVGLRVDKYELLAVADRLFLDEFEGRYAEYCDLSSNNEQLLKASLVSYVRGEASTSPTTPLIAWSFQQSGASVESSPSSSAGMAGTITPAQYSMV